MYISGQSFNSLCTWNIDTRYPLRRWDDKNFKEGDSVFMKICDIPVFLNSPPPGKSTIVIHNSDETFTDQLYSLLEPYAIVIYAVNCQTSKAIQIPLGFRDDMYTPHEDISNTAKINNKDILCLVNFSLHTNTTERTHVLDLFKTKSFATIDGDYFIYNKALNFSNPETVQRRRSFYQTLARSRFVICPPGTGVDTHRVYESIIFGAIPIVKTSFLDPLYSNLGVVIVKDWNEVTEEFLNNIQVDYPFDFSNIKYFLPLSHTVSFISYADRVFESAGKRIEKEARKCGIFDTIKIFSRSDLDQDFMAKNKYLLSQSRGGGYWCWKPYIVLKTMNTLPDGHWILYADAGCTLIDDRKFQVIEYIRKMETLGKEVSAYQMDHLEKTFTKGDLLSFFNASDEIKNSGIYVGGVFLIKKTPSMIRMIQTVIDIIETKPTLVDNTPSVIPNDPTFIEHRHDQSIFSIIRKLETDKVFVIPKDETWHGNDFVQAIRSKT